MTEVIWHARGGQGAFTAARCLGAAATLSAGAHALAFPTFGPERRGAPMCAYTKISHAPIGDRSAVQRADIVVYLDETLLHDGWESELAPGGIMLLNTSHATDDARIIGLDADAISANILGRPIPNTAFLGAIAAVSDAVALEDIHAGIKATMSERLQEKNLKIASAAYEALTSCNGRTTGERKANAREGNNAASEAFAQALSHAKARPEGRFTPQLHSTFSADPSQFARLTCFTAGHLVSENAGWRSVKPVLDPDACTMCLSCYMSCPDGTIYKMCNDAGAATALGIDYGFCKGCGVCAEVCPAHCIAMIPEEDAEVRA